MKSKAIVCAIVALSMSSGGLAYAQNYQGDGDRYVQQEQRRAQSPQPVQRGNQGRRAYQGRMGDNAQRGDRGVGPNHQFHRGDRLPAEYRHRQYVVDNWREHHLSAPPRGYHWVQNGNDYVLVAIATGVILQLLLNN